MPIDLNDVHPSHETSIAQTIEKSSAPAIIELPVLTTGLTGQARKPEVLLGMQPVVLDAEEFSVEEAPTVITGYELDVARSPDGRFFKRLCDRPDRAAFDLSERGRDRLLTALGFYDRRDNLLRANGRDWFNALTTPSSIFGAIRLLDLNEVPIRQRDDDLIETQVKAFDKLVASAALIGDGLYIRCDEPHLIVGIHWYSGPSANLSTDLSNGLNRLSRGQFSAVFPVTTQPDVIRDKLRPFIKQEKGELSIVRMTIHQAEVFSHALPLENAALMARVATVAFRDAMSIDTCYSLPRLRNAGYSSIELLDEIQTALGGYLADKTAAAPLVNAVNDLLDLPDDAAVWALLRRDEAMAHTVEFVREQLEAMEISLELFPSPGDGPYSLA
ncbi:hypothetical protein [Rhizobium sp. 9140]|uniref:hypothetical protein n=1 Tax=Rhizobium sp. 9140 TaxID=1761900 RepID=UPI00079ABF1B|nr:hypothetical protein [Rhizobium sp. 9140]CZT38070.1 hypothetical protein GA0004734_00049450 [Rhizobium sp. 9140]